MSAPTTSTVRTTSKLATHSSQTPGNLSTLPRQSTTGIDSLAVGPSSISPHHHSSHQHSSFTASPASFLNHHANRLKSKLVPNAANSSSSSTLTKHQINASPSMSSSHWTSQRNSLIIMANAAAIELYFLCIEDESDAEKLCTKCSEKFFLSNMSLSDTILQAPLIASCIQVYEIYLLNKTKITSY